MTDFVIPEIKGYPINKPEDVKTALDVFNDMGGPINYTEFITRLKKIAELRGFPLPIKVRKELGLYKENSYEQREFERKSRKTKPHRMQHDEYYDDF